MPARNSAWSSLDVRMPTELIATVEYGGIPSKQKSKVSGVAQQAVGITSTPCDCQYAPHHRLRYVFQSCPARGMSRQSEKSGVKDAPTAFTLGRSLSGDDHTVSNR